MAPSHPVQPALAPRLPHRRRRPRHRRHGSRAWSWCRSRGRAGSWCSSASAILASEFDWAKRLLDFGKEKLRAWNDWIRPQPLWVKGLAALLTAVLVGLIFYVLFLLAGVPALLPDVLEIPLQSVPGL